MLLFPIKDEALTILILNSPESQEKPLIGYLFWDIFLGAAFSPPLPKKDCPGKKEAPGPGGDAGADYFYVTATWR